MSRGKRCSARLEESNDNLFAGLSSKETTMILPQVHLRKPCYDFSFL